MVTLLSSTRPRLLPDVTTANLAGRPGCTGDIVDECQLSDGGAASGDANRTSCRGAAAICKNKDHLGVINFIELLSRVFMLACNQSIASSPAAFGG